MTVSAQDLVLEGVTGPATYERYGEFAPTITIKNNGIVDITGWFYVRLFLSSDHVPDQAEQFQSSPSIIAMAAGESKSVVFPGLRIDAAPRA